MKIKLNTLTLLILVALVLKHNVDSVEPEALNLNFLPSSPPNNYVFLNKLTLM